MQENPYSAMLQMLRRDAAEHTVAPWRLGRVVSASPLIVEVAGLQLSGSDLLVNEQLLMHARAAELRGVSGSLTAGNDDPECAMSSLTVSGGGLAASAQLSGVLAAGDQVALLQSGDGQQYVVLCKVVSAS